MVLVGLPLLALHFTHYPLAVAGVAVASRTPGLLVALPAGALADRVSRRRLLAGMEGARFVAVGLFALAVLAGWDSLALLYVAAVLLGGLTTAFDVASSASLPAIAERSQLVNANARLLMVDLTGEELVGQALGGVAFGLARSLPFVGDAASSAISAGVLWAGIPDNTPEPHRQSIRSDLASGLRWFVHQPLMRVLVAMVGGLAFCQAVVTGVLALYASDSLHIGAAAYGLFLAVAGVGNVIGAVLAPPVHRRIGGAWSIIGAAVVAACVYPLMAATRSALVAAVGLAAECSSVMVGNVAVRSLRQNSVPDDMQGRAASTFTTIVLTVVPTGALVGGLTVAWLGVRPTFVAAGVLQALFVLAGGPALHRLAGGEPPTEPGGAQPTPTGSPRESSAGTRSTS